MNECTRKIKKKGDQSNWIENLEIDHETYDQVFGLSYLDLVKSIFDQIDPKVVIGMTQ
jgi:hypothetical protein